MNKVNSVFDPDLPSLFNPQYQNDFTMDRRQLFYQLNQSSNDHRITPVAYSFITQALEDAKQQYSSLIIQEYSTKKLLTFHTSKITALSKPFLTQDNQRECIKQTAAIHLTQPCWLENTFQIACCQTKTALQLMPIYQQLSQQESFKLTSLYHSLLLSERIKIPLLHNYAYSHSNAILPDMLDFASIQLALSRFPRVLLPEILGFTLAYCQMPTLIESCFSGQILPSPFFKYRNQAVKKQLTPLLKGITDYLDLFLLKQQALWHRIQHGYWLYQLQMTLCKNQFEQMLTQKEKPKIKQVNSPQNNQLSTHRNYAKLSNRELYYYLINADLFPDVLTITGQKINRWLRLTEFFNPLPFKQYSHQKFESFIENIYQKEVGAYQSIQGQPKTSKAAYIWGIEQIAPMILIDGCWLQKSLTIQGINPEISDILFTIYSDETGNGLLQNNHCYIFQNLLNSLSINVPAVHSEAFVMHSGFIDTAFDLPVYMLALSNNSTKFLPELLGLNMAIELSGLGKDYQQLVDEWNYWGIDSTIANIHISIDNYATGHTLLAKKAIQLYMDDISKRNSNTKTLDMHWRRIYTGYASLRCVGERFKQSLPLYYVLKKIRCSLA